MSDYRPSSEVRMLSARPREWQPVSRDLLRVLTQAQEIARLSGGAFDVTVGPLVQLWRQSRRTRQLPDAAALARARSRVDYHLLEVDSVRSAVRLWTDSMQLDLGAIAKGFILQEALDVLRARGVAAAMIEAGGDLVVGDAPPGSAGWSIEIPGADSASAEYAKALVNVAVATSGGSQQFVEIGGVRYAHVVDPRTGLGLVNAGEVTVIGRRGELVDAVATAMLVLSSDHGRAGALGTIPGVLRVVTRFK
jgi:thiamine biosynthesis lipoprotein